MTYGRRGKSQRRHRIPEDSKATVLALERTAHSERHDDKAATSRNDHRSHRIPREVSEHRHWRCSSDFVIASITRPVGPLYRERFYASHKRFDSAAVNWLALLYENQI